MAATAKEQRAGERVDALLDELGRSVGPSGRDLADELVRSIVEFYGSGLARVVELLGDRPDGTDPLALLGGDELVGGLLILHDLHPDDTLTRVERALDEVRPYLGSHAGDVDIAGIGPDGDGGTEGLTLRLRLRGSCDGCPSSAQTVRWTIEEAVARRAPEIGCVEVEGVAREKPQPKLLQIMSRPPDATAGAVPAGGTGTTAAHTAGTATGNAPAEWHPLPDPPTADGATGVREVAGTALLLVRLPGNLYAYRDRCPVCAGGLGGAALVDGERLRCPECAAEYEIRGAGRGTRGRLEPVPLLEENGCVRVALPVSLLTAKP
ncbi:NifU family protein [Streptomyces lushanensis]|uniref:NifU family protein n=1 Tax=Streptomyces lushanensis TaxID=1434255 RepID=UPI0008369EB7|nr:NifU family protein [Streptomyces lushanensis]